VQELYCGHWPPTPVNPSSNVNTILRDCSHLNFAMPTERSENGEHVHHAREEKLQSLRATTRGYLQKLSSRSSSILHVSWLQVGRRPILQPCNVELPAKAQLLRSFVLGRISWLLKSSAAPPKACSRPHRSLHLDRARIDVHAPGCNSHWHWARRYRKRSILKENSLILW
jgi:hypothetical protein